MFVTESSLLHSTLGPVVRLWLDEFREDLCEPPQHPALRQLSVQLRHRLRFRRLAQSTESLLRQFQQQSTSSTRAALSCVWFLNGLHSHSAFFNQWPNSKRFTILPNIHPFVHTFTH